MGVSVSPEVIECKFFNCKKPATVKIKVMSGACFCDDHYQFNVRQFGCKFIAEPINQQPTEQE